MEPLTRMGTRLHATQRGRENRKAAGPGVPDRPFPVDSAAERVTAGATARGVRVVDREALLLDRVGEVDRRAAEVRGAHAIDDDRDAVQVELEVTVEGALVEEQLVLQARAATRLDGHTQAQIVTTLLL